MARERASRISKLSAGVNSPRHGSRAPRRIASFTSSAQTQLEQIAQLATVAQDGDIIVNKGADRDNSVDTTPASSFDASTIFSTNSSFGHNLHHPLDPALNTNFHLDELMMPDGRSAAEIALQAFGDTIKIDSALCKKLATELALRPPVQRRSDQRLNIERRSNVEAVLCHITGQVTTRQCKNCHKGHGPWTQCIILEGQMCGSCSNCWFNASGARCTFHENNNSTPAIFNTGPYTAIPNALSSQQAPVALPQMTSASGLFQSSATPIQPPTGLLGSRSMPSGLSSGDIDDQTLNILTEAMSSRAGLSERQRHVARIEAAAKELAIRIADYEAFLRSEEGLNDQSLHQGPAIDQIHSRSTDHGVNDEESPTPSTLLD